MTPTDFAAWRAGMDWTQPVTAKQMGVSLDTVKSWETGRNPIPDWAIRLIGFLRIDIPRMERGYD